MHLRKSTFRKRHRTWQSRLRKDANSVFRISIGAPSAVIETWRKVRPCCDRWIRRNVSSSHFCGRILLWMYHVKVRLNYDWSQQKRSFCSRKIWKIVIWFVKAVAFVDINHRLHSERNSACTIKFFVWFVTRKKEMKWHFYDGMRFLTRKIFCWTKCTMLYNVLHWSCSKHINAPGTFAWPRSTDSYR